MPTDTKYTATWLSHSAISDFLNCPRSYELKYVYRDPQTRHKISVVSPALSLGQTVHQVLESLSVLPTQSRFSTSLLAKYQQAWDAVSGKKGGFLSPEQEEKYRERGRAMLGRVESHPGPISRKAVKINQDLPHYWLSPEDGLILCGKLDWLEYLPETNQVNIIDFKTSRQEEAENSFQLPIYYLLASNCQSRPVAKAYYWYLEWSDEPSEKTLPDLDEVKNQLITIGKKMRLVRKLGSFKCANPGSCRYCRDYEAIVRGESECVGTNEYGTDLHLVRQDHSSTENEIDDSTIL